MTGEGMRLQVIVWLDFMGLGVLDTGLVCVRRVVCVCVCVVAVTAEILRLLNEVEKHRHTFRHPVVLYNGRKK